MRKDEEKKAKPMQNSQLFQTTVGMKSTGSQNHLIHFSLIQQFQLLKYYSSIQKVSLLIGDRGSQNNAQNQRNNW